MTPDRETRHATTVALDGAAILIQGPSGSGKSALALQLIALGARLVADDRSGIELRDGVPWVVGPERLAGVIEARFVGLLCAPHEAAAPLRLIVEMSAPETARLPEPATETVLGVAVERIGRVDAAHFPASIVALVRYGRHRDA